ncbi:MAG: DUF484 family protein [Pseudomonadales bacterium]
MSAIRPAQQIAELDDEQVVAFLRDNADFFDRQPDVLADLTLPHESGAAVSLVERQQIVLRERNQELRSRLGKLLENARDNDRLFELTRRLVLDLLLADSLSTAVASLDKSLSKDFKTDFNSLYLFGTEELIASHYRCVTPATARESVGNLMDARQVICGTLRQEENEFLFNDNAPHIKSAAVVPIGTGTNIGLLAVGSRDPQHYKSGMGTLFLSYIGEVLAHALPRHL